MNNAIVISALAWLIPGAGHFLQRKWWQGTLLFIIVISLVLLGVRLGGLQYPGSPAEYGLMYWLQVVSSAGNGLYLICNFLFKSSSPDAVTDAFRSAYFEYSGRSLALAGLLNYLAVLDIFDRSTNRKQ